LGHRDDLDGEGKKDRRSQVLSDHIRQTFSTKTAWSEWGIVDGVLVWQNST
jgi:hypothetical protein